MIIKILGPGCAKCKTLANTVEEIVKTGGYNAQIIKVEDIMEIMNYNVISTPALVVNENIEIKGRVPGWEEIKSILEKYKE